MRKLKSMYLLRMQVVVFHTFNVLSRHDELRNEMSSVAGQNYDEASDAGTQIFRLFLWQISLTDIRIYITKNVQPMHESKSWV